jgi:hypothetical protein
MPCGPPLSPESVESLLMDINCTAWLQRFSEAVSSQAVEQAAPDIHVTRGRAISDTDTQQERVPERLKGSDIEQADYIPPPSLTKVSVLEAPSFRLPNQRNKLALVLDPVSDEVPFTFGVEIFPPGMLLALCLFLVTFNARRTNWMPPSRLISMQPTSCLRYLLSRTRWSLCRSQDTTSRPRGCV